MAADYGRTPAVIGDAARRREVAGRSGGGGVRLGLFALVRLKAYEPLAAAVLDATVTAVTTWWPVAFALGRIGDARAQPALLELLRARREVLGGVCGARARRDQGSAAVDPLLALVESAADAARSGRCRPSARSR